LLIRSIASAGVSSTSTLGRKLGSGALSRIYSFQRGFILFIWAVDGLPFARRIRASYSVLLEPWKSVKLLEVKAFWAGNTGLCPICPNFYPG